MFERNVCGLGTSGDSASTVELGMKITHLSAKFAVLEPKYVTYVNRVHLMRKYFEGGHGEIPENELRTCARLRGTLNSMKTFVKSPTTHFQFPSSRCVQENH